MRWTITDYVRRGDADGVWKCLGDGGDIEERRSSSYTPLISAAYYNKCKMIELLLDEGADIEAVDRSGLSALRTAIYYGQDEAALLLAQRGADASVRAYQQKTALYAAVEQRKLEVVKVLLLNGADPFVQCGNNNRTAIDLVSSGELLVLLKTFTDLGMAIDARSMEAVQLMLKKALSSDDDAQVLKAYGTLKKTLDVALWDWHENLSKLVEQFEIDMLHRALRNGSTDFVDKVNTAVGKPAWVSTALLDGNGRNALHVAASLGNLRVVSYLLETHECDSTASDYHGHKAVELVKNTDECHQHISWILTEHEKKTQFLELTSQFLDQSQVTAMELNELPQFMTSIYDLRVVFCLGYGALTKAEMKQLLQNSFSEAVRMKLMFDNDAAVYFKTALRECKRHELISQKEKDEWQLEAGKVNGENADWVRGIQNSFSQLEHRVTVTERNISSLNKNYQSLRSALENKIHLDDERMRRRRLIGLVTSGLCFCGGSVLEGAFIWAFDAWTSAEIFLTELAETSSEDRKRSR
ncbi:hypothetical protein PHYPSEUDO_009406 [Phytophthora pseudosyringae]|uniref:Uncharacterized protein n=1 Tax=Phytophthora pseudosyringae TaxID=221518 RepID=A0A8T1W7F7_9STRA|nr:hypothetical protein PHYPSEUDO_009406 [Phytophthora pseudosyringae]